MRDKIKHWIPTVGILGVLLGRILNRNLTSTFGNSASSNIVFVLCSIIFLILLIQLIRRKYKEAIAIFLMLIPVILMGVGMYYDNLIIGFLGLILLVAILPIVRKIGESME
ncbi:hypothetical protein [Inconstantimicrobium mannanitabidum]|uniref:Uncharacterized protein n=1 Tax=Inconstantimicrobium mannanitabidum TaxID=1604901 RepID=A0ACB5RHQ1_9CLOT|nr:hypothetical protein [Clostridium sp. TW13]GKX68624.1 hypothetical protein rsdtw13_38820 [Clostridium sp. TW13]